jgi:hypothetical protein
MFNSLDTLYVMVIYFGDGFFFWGFLAVLGLFCFVFLF